MEHTEIEKLSNKYRFSIDVLRHLQTVYDHELEKAVKALKSPGKRYYLRINTLKTETDEVIKRFKEGGIKVKKYPKIDEVLFLPIKGPYKVPLLEKRVAVDKFTGEAVLQGAHVYAPGITKCAKLHRNDRVTIVDHYGQPIATGIARMSETEILSHRRGLAVEVTHPMYKVTSLREREEFKNGLIYPQSLPAILASKILDPQTNEIIVDLTCSPGGKLSHISQLMKNTGHIIGVDRNKQKISIAKETITRLGCENVTLIPHDARYFDVDFPHVKADRCILDPPCSALGVIPKLYEHKSNEEVQALAEYQKQFLKVASRVVKPRGIIVYSVCTVTVNECEEVVKFGLEKCGLSLEEQKIFLGSAGLTWVLPEAKLTQRFHPHIHGTSGYFIARFRKKF